MGERSVGSGDGSRRGGLVGRWLCGLLLAATAGGLAGATATDARPFSIDRDDPRIQLRADLAQSQSAAGDLFAAAGKFADAIKTWDKALATLEEGLKANPNSIASTM